ncbi:hypothetical protein EDWATA_01497 [Edwardsiella tarda ATCC 23685]|uniref:Uncharacterized protein n=1 Tax=Edwardsiella tarda ATCC 23685 TaxID=500638 RepID=D4F428_EDWTA|nr:hypothetical protein EDWATA_01497 [Edwardsiella tarda ATCC 23685]
MRRRPGGPRRISPPIAVGRYRPMSKKRKNNNRAGTLQLAG